MSEISGHDPHFKYIIGLNHKMETAKIVSQISNQITQGLFDSLANSFPYSVLNSAPNSVPNSFPELGCLFNSSYSHSFNP